MKLALVCDDLIQFGGAERLVLALYEIWPDAPLYTSFASKTWKRRCRDLKINLRTSWMQKLPFKERLYRYYFIFFSYAFESFNFNDFDVVLSVSARFAHGIITGPETKHICYMNTPPRMFWEPFDYYFGRWRSLMLPFLSWLRVRDFNAAQRPDTIIANSKTPQARIKKYYGREAGIIYPFVELDRFESRVLSGAFPRPTSSQAAGARRGSPCPRHPLSFDSEEKDSFFLVVSRLQAWKRIGLAIKACNQLKLLLIIVGEGPDEKRLRRLSGPTVKLLGNLTDEEVVDYYYKCRALLFPQIEDFGITPLEAMAAGKPVIAARAGGALETVISGKTGEFFYPQTVEALIDVLRNFNPKKYDQKECRKQAERFGKERFVKGIRKEMSNVKTQMPASLNASQGGSNLQLKSVNLEI